MNTPTGVQVNRDSIPVGWHHEPNKGWLSMNEEHYDGVSYIRCTVGFGQQSRTKLLLTKEALEYDGLLSVETHKALAISLEEDYPEFTDNQNWQEWKTYVMNRSF